MELDGVGPKETGPRASINSRLCDEGMTEDSAFSEMSTDAPPYPLLILDTSSRTTWVGLLSSPGEAAVLSEEQDPSKSLFALLEPALHATGFSLGDIASVAFCRGPGSMLGARTAAMAIRSWQAIGLQGSQRLYAYNSLQAAACLAVASPLAPESGSVVTDARRSTWNLLPFPADPNCPLELLSTEALEQRSEPLVTFKEFPTWTPTEARLLSLPYQPVSLFLNEGFTPFLKPVETATPLVIRTSDYKKWDARIHSAPRP